MKGFLYRGTIFIYEVAIELTLSGKIPIAWGVKIYVKKYPANSMMNAIGPIIKFSKTRML